MPKPSFRHLLTPAMFTCRLLKLPSCSISPSEILLSSPLFPPLKISLMLMQKNVFLRVHTLWKMIYVAHFLEWMIIWPVVRVFLEGEPTILKFEDSHTNRKTLSLSDTHVREGKGKESMRGRNGRREEERGGLRWWDREAQRQAERQKDKDRDWFSVPVCLFWSFVLIKPPGLNHGSSTLMTLSNVNYLPKPHV